MTDLAVPHLTQWIKAKKWPSSSTHNSAVRAVRRYFRWDVEEGLIPTFALHGLKAPSKTVREREITLQVFEAILQHFRQSVLGTASIPLAYRRPASGGLRDRSTNSIGIRMPLS
jgi:hypothetical protein